MSSKVFCETLNVSFLFFVVSSMKYSTTSCGVVSLIVLIFVCSIFLGFYLLLKIVPIAFTVHFSRLD